MGRRKTTNKVPPFKDSRNSRSTDVDDELRKGVEARSSGHEAFGDGVVDSTRHAQPPSADITGPHHDKWNIHLGSAETREDLVSTPPRQRQSDSSTEGQPRVSYSGKVCRWYVRTSKCKYGDRCIHYHPPGIEPPDLNSMGYPLRPGQRICPFYLKNGWCKFVHTCENHHPELCIVDESAYSVIDLPGANYASGYVLSPVPHSMPPQGWWTPMSMPPSMNQYPYMSQTPSPPAPMNAGWMPWFYTHPRMTTFRYWPTQEGHRFPSLPTFESDSSFDDKFYQEDEEQNYKDSLKEDETSEYDEN